LLGYIEMKLLTKKKSLKKRASPAKTRSTAHPLLSLRGIAKDLFGKLGGGERFVRSERGKFVGVNEGKSRS
jgi:hypothetical protein